MDGVEKKSRWLQLKRNTIITDERLILETKVILLSYGKQKQNNTVCEDEFKGSPRDFAKIEVGFTKKGIQVWCITHEINIAHFDLCGNKVQII